MISKKRKQYLDSIGYKLFQPEGNLDKWAWCAPNSDYWEEGYETRNDAWAAAHNDANKKISSIVIVFNEEHVFLGAIPIKCKAECLFDPAQIAYKVGDCIDEHQNPSGCFYSLMMDWNDDRGARLASGMYRPESRWCRITSFHIPNATTVEVMPANFDPRKSKKKR